MECIYVVKCYYWEKNHQLLMVDDMLAYKTEKEGQDYLDRLIEKHKMGKLWEKPTELVSDIRREKFNELRLRSVNFLHQSGGRTSYVLDELLLIN